MVIENPPPNVSATISFGLQKRKSKQLPQTIYKFSGSNMIVRSNMNVKATI